MPQQDIMNLLIYDLSHHRAPQEISSNKKIISEIVEGWNQNKYVFPQHKINFTHQKNKDYRLM